MYVSLKPSRIVSNQGIFQNQQTGKALITFFFFFDRECPARHPKTYSSLLLYHQSLFMKYVQLTIKVKCHLVVWFGTKVPPGGIIWYWNATWWYNLVLKCHLAASFGTKFDKCNFKKNSASWCSYDLAFMHLRFCAVTNKQSSSITTVWTEKVRARSTSPPV